MKLRESAFKLKKNDVIHCSFPRTRAAARRSDPPYPADARELSTNTGDILTTGAPCPMPCPRKVRVRKIRFPEMPSGAMMIPQSPTAFSMRISPLNFLISSDRRRVLRSLRRRRWFCRQWGVCLCRRVCRRRVRRFFRRGRSGGQVHGRR